MLARGHMDGRFLIDINHRLQEEIARSQKQPSDIASLFRLAEDEWQLGNFRQSQQFYEQLLSKATLPEAAKEKAKIELAGVYRDAGAYDKSLAVLNELLSTDIKGASPRYEVARDENDLGVVTFLKAASLVKETDRQLALLEARSHLMACWKLYDSLPDSDSRKAMIKRNLSVVSRELAANMPIRPARGRNFLAD
jgi:hypothetical protein